MRFTFRRRSPSTLFPFEGIPADGDPYYTDWYPTAMETKVIAMCAAKGVANIQLPVLQQGVTTYYSFCGDCGRMICHPSCPKVVRARACAMNPEEKA